MTVALAVGALILLAAAFVVVPRLIGSAAASAVDAGFRAAGAGMSQRRRNHPTFLHSLPPTTALQSLNAITSILPGTTVTVTGDAAVIRPPGGSQVQAVCTAAAGKPNQLLLNPVGPVDQAEFARVRAGVLAALRTQDPAARAK